jgi:hypothetical protein
MPLAASLDTSIVSGAVRGQLTPDERADLDVTLEAHESGQIQLVRSKALRVEHDRIPQKYRAPHEDLARRLVKVPEIYEFWPPMTNMTVGGVGCIKEDPLRTSLAVLLPDVGDADHVFQTARNGIKFLITRDKKTVLRHHDAIESRAGVKVVSLRTFVEIIRDQSKAER